MNPHSGGKAGVRLVSLLVQTSPQELEGLSEGPHRVVRARGVGGWGLRFLILSAAMCGCLLMAKKYEEAERWLAAAAAFVPVSKEPAPLLQASSPSINIVRVNTRTLLQPRYYHNNINTAIA